eukprot:scaffold157783_cov25-Cyclotella_meneghiniana.AAC.1
MVTHQASSQSMTSSPQQPQSRIPCQQAITPTRFIVFRDEIYRVRKASSSGDCLVDVSRALAMLGWRIHINEVWKDDANTPTTTEAYNKIRTKSQICHEIRRRVL